MQVIGRENIDWSSYWKSTSLNDAEGEKWCDVAGYCGKYLVSSYGRVKSLQRVKDGIIMALSMNRKGYLYVQFPFKRDNSKRRFKHFKVHRLVGVAFVPNPENLSEINHKKGIKTDNRATEIEWSTQKDNVKHSYRIGLKRGVRGERSHYAKLTEVKVLAIREMKERGETYAEISREYQISPDYASEICRRKTWKHI